MGEILIEKLKCLSYALKRAIHFSIRFHGAILAMSQCKISIEITSIEMLNSIVEIFFLSMGQPYKEAAVVKEPWDWY